MPKFSAFTPFGMFAFSSKSTHAENIYNALIASLGDNFTPGGHADDSAYARAMGLARARYTLEHAGYQIDPLKVTEMVALREAEYDVVPGVNDTLPQRRAVLASRKLLPAGYSSASITNALRSLLGADFIAFRPTTTAEMTLWPATIGAQPMNLQLPIVPIKHVTITQSVSVVGAQTVTYASVVLPVNVAQGAPATHLLAGDVIVVDPASSNQAERLTITAATATTFTATFTKSHDINTLATTMPFPWWMSTKRASLIVLSAAAAIDIEKRRKVHELMQRMARGVSTWGIVATTGAGTAGPFKVETSPLDATPIGTVSY